MSLGSLEGLAADELGKALPIVMGDRVKKSPLVGVDPAYLDFRDLRIREGRRFAVAGECILGADVARREGLSIDDRITTEPREMFDLAGAYPLRMRVVGVLESSGSADDGVVFTSPATAWIVQGLAHGHDRVEDETEWDTALADSLQYGGAVLCEECIQGRELTVGILDGDTLPVVEVRPKAGGYNYENKYTPGATDYFCPADLPNEATAQVQTLGLRAFEAVGARDFGRVDVMLDAESKPYILEVNTLPGMTETSLLPKAAAVAGMDFNALCQRMLELALRRN